MELIDFDQFKSATHLNKFGGDVLAKFLMQLLRYQKVNQLYAKFAHQSGTDFIDSILDVLGVKFEIDPADLERIPKEGPFITVSNHPYGGLDGLILIKILTKVRPDYKVIVNYLLQKIEPLDEFFLPVNPFEDYKEAANSLRGTKLAFQHVQNGAPLGIFPAGEVSSYQISKHEIADREWLLTAIKFAHKSNVPIVPIYFQGNNSRLFQLLGRIHPLLRTAKLPSELFNKKKKTIQLKIGNPISVADQQSFSDISQFGRFIRAKTYSLGSTIKPGKFFYPLQFNKPAKPEPIVDAVPKEVLTQEIEQAKSDYLLFDSKEFSVLCAPANVIPNVLHEIGRLREITFREVGEGTNLKIDIDEYDLYYMQLVIWDNNEQQIAGAYRVGKGKDIMAQYGKKGFYLQSLFRMKRAFKPILEESLELGRSFIVKDYQRKPLSLFMLWKGILYFLLKNPEYRYLIGPVSISNDFSKFSKDLLVSFVQSYFYDNELAEHIVPRKKFKLDKEFFDEKEAILQSSEKDFKKLDKFIKDLENSSIPVLLKKYISLNAKIIGFNTDPKFNDCLDGLIILDVYDVPMDTLHGFSKELNDDTILERFKQDMGMEFNK